MINQKTYFCVRCWCNTANLAISQMLTSLDDEFNQEIQEKQVAVEAQRSKLRQATLALSDRRRQLDHLRSQTDQLTESRQRSRNVERAINDEESKLFNPDDWPLKMDKSEIYEGKIDADAPFLISGINFSSNSANEHLPTQAILKARIIAYKDNEEKLQNLCAQLKGRSSELEDKFRKVVALCTGVEETRVDSLLDNLVQAVQSDPTDIDLGRIKGFLRHIQDEQ